MKTHFIYRDAPLTERLTEAECGTPCEVLREIPTDADLQDFDIRSLSKCKVCKSAKAKKYTYLGTPKV